MKSPQLESVYVDDKVFMRIQGLQVPFANKNRWWVGIRDSWIRQGQKMGVEKFIVELDKKFGGDAYIPMPTEKQLKKKEKVGDFSEEIIKYPNNPLKLYFFAIK